MNELTEREKAYIQTVRKEYRSSDSDIDILENDKNNQEWFGYAYDLQQSKIDELVKALEFTENIVNSEYITDTNLGMISFVVHEALEKHKVGK